MTLGPGVPRRSMPSVFPESPCRPATTMTAVFLSASTTPRNSHRSRRVGSDTSRTIAPAVVSLTAHPPGYFLRIALDGTQRVPRDALRVRAEPPELARGQFLDLSPLVPQPPPQPLGQIVRARKSWAYSPPFSRQRSPVAGSSAVMYPCLGAAPQGPPPARRQRHRFGFALVRARRAGAGSPGSGRGARVRAGGRPAAAPPRRRRGVRVAALSPVPGHPADSSRARG